MSIAAVWGRGTDLNLHFCRHHQKQLASYAGKHAGLDVGSVIEGSDAREVCGHGEGTLESFHLDFWETFRQRSM